MKNTDVKIIKKIKTSIFSNNIFEDNKLNFRKVLYAISNKFNIFLSETTKKERLAKEIFSNGNLPASFSINLGAAPCNHSCLFCPQSIHKPRKASWLDLSILKKVVDELPEKGVLINISSYSETLAAPNLVDAIKLLKSRRPNLKIVMATNGSLMREEVVRNVISSGLDHYSYSFDAPDKESYHRLMQADDFDRVWDNLLKIVEIRKEINPRMKITTHIMGFDEFREPFIEFKKFWKDKVDDVIWRPVGNWGGETWGLEENLNKAGFRLSEFKIPKERYPCNSIFMHFKMQHDGRYAPCVAAVPDFAPDEEMHNVPYIGSAHEITWTDAWNKLTNMRQAHLKGRWHDYKCCSTCNIWALWPNVWNENRSQEINGNKFYIDKVDHAN